MAQPRVLILIISSIFFFPLFSFLVRRSALFSAHSGVFREGVALRVFNKVDGSLPETLRTESEKDRTLRRKSINV